MASLPRDVERQYTDEIRRCWDIIDLLLEPPGREVLAFVDEEDHLRSLVQGLVASPSMNCQAAGALAQRGMGATVVYWDTTMPEPEEPRPRPLGRDWESELEKLQQWARDSRGPAVDVDLDTVPVWAKLFPARGPALVVAESATDFLPLVSIACWDSQGKPFLADTVNSVQRMAGQLARALGGAWLEEEVRGAGHYVSNTLAQVQGYLAELSILGTGGEDADREAIMSRLEELAAELAQIESRLGLAATWVGNVTRPPAGPERRRAREAGYRPFPVPELLREVVEPASGGVGIEMRCSSSSVVYVRRDLLEEVVVSIMEAARLLCQPSRLMVDARDLGRWVEIGFSWPGKPLTPRQVSYVNGPQGDQPADGGETGQLLAARSRLAILRGQMNVRSAPGRGTSVYVHLPIRGKPVDGAKVGKEDRSNVE